MDICQLSDTYRRTVTFNLRQQVDWLYSYRQKLSNLDLKLLIDSTDTTISGKLFHIGTIRCEK